ncbi:MAG TPA: hypothetical protein VI423_04765 [Paenisporosarcina sp.]|nr:hypothetical protein [Paenisporosarcina sp.]
MKQALSNSRGYALLLTMLLVVFFLALSTMFISSSLNHSLQEQTVDNSNQAVVAAEMGSQYYIKNVENLVKLEAQKFIPTVQLELDKIRNRFNISLAEHYRNASFSKRNEFYLECRPFLDDKKFVELLDCEIDEMKKAQPSKFMQQLNIANLTTKVNLTERKVNVERNLNYKINNIEAVKSSENDEIIVNIDVEGSIGSQVKQNLRSEVNIGSPDFLSVNKTPIISYSEGAVSDIFEPPNDTNRICTEPADTNPKGTCTYTGNDLETFLTELPVDSEVIIKVTDYCAAIGATSTCNFSNFDGQNVPIYIKPPNGVLDAGNTNQLKDSIFYIDGSFELNNLNQSSGNTIITRSLEMHNGVNLTDTTIVIMGNTGKTGLVKWKETGTNSLTIGQDSKMCVNLNAMDLDVSSSFADNSFNFSGNGKIIYYPRMTHDKLLPETPNQVIYTDDFEDFLRQCSVSMININGEYQMESMENGDFNFDTFINYNP